MKIDHLGSAGAASSVRRKGDKRASGDFAALLDTGEEEVSSAAPVGGIASLNPLGGLLAAQMVDVNEERRRAVSYGDTLLDSLDRLRHDLLAGAVHPATVQNLARDMRAKAGSITDPELAALLEEIETRAAVELAKLEMAQEREEASRP